MTYVLASLLDRLMPAAVEEPSTAARFSLSTYAASIARDLEALLNTRNILIGREHLQGILGFGIPDFSSMTLASAPDRARMSDAVRRAIETHEPRLADPNVTLGDREGCNASLHFVIKGRLMVKPFDAAMSFRADFLSTTLRFSVSAAKSVVG
jgi:type VI secretion system protein ImpF